MEQSPKSNAKPKTADLPYEPQHEWSFQAIGTHWWVGIYERHTAADIERLHGLISARIEIFDRTYSRFRPDSLVTRMSKLAGTYEFPADSELLFAWYRRLYDATDGLVTPLIGQTLADAGYDANYSLTPKTLHQPPAWDDVLRIRGRTVTAAQPIVLDVGAAGKGYLVDIISQLLKSEGIHSFCVDASGDMRLENLRAPLKIGMENPHNTDEVIGVVSMQRGALCASAGNRRAWSNFNHIMHPQRLQSVTEVEAVWVAAATTMEADGLATALFFVPPAALARTFHFAYCVLKDNTKVRRSTDFPATLFTGE
jgi:thiamine biosynthesis lipoprotein